MINKIRDININPNKINIPTAFIIIFILPQPKNTAVNKE